MADVLIVDDDLDALEFMAEAVAKEYSVLTAGTLVEARNALAKEPISVVVSDFRLPDGSGLDLVYDLESLCPSPPLIMLSGFVDKEFAMDAANAHVFALLEKPVPTTRILESVRKAISKSLLQITEEIPTARDERFSFDKAQLQVVENGVVTQLTPTEFAILQYVVARAGRKIPREDLFKAVWGTEAMDRANLDTHVYRLKTKIPSLKKSLRAIWGGFLVYIPH